MSAGTQLSIAVAPVREDIPKYDRGEWRHWADEDGDCQDARQESLIAESETSVTYTNDDRCRVASGSWAGPYTGEVFTDPGSLDIDHMVPLANAHRSGGWAWSEDKKREYANDLSYDGHLIAVKASANRSKGSKGPEGWKPPEYGYWCRYAIDWISIKNAWELTATESEAATLEQMLDTCEPSRFAGGRSGCLFAAGCYSLAHPGPARPTPPATRPRTRMNHVCAEARGMGAGSRLQWSQAPETAMATGLCASGEGGTYGTTRSMTIWRSRHWIGGERGGVHIAFQTDQSVSTVSHQRPSVDWHSLFR